MSAASGTKRSQLVFARVIAISAVFLLSFAALLASSTATALPPGGASPDTPGTWSNVGGSAKAGGTLSFTVGGFPPGELMNIKIDDGALCSNTSHGACVIHQQRIPSSGVISGYVTIPADTPSGSHWLRFLSSALVDSDDPLGGTSGYTLRSANFSVTRGGAGGGASSGSSGDSGAGTSISRGDAPVSSNGDDLTAAGGVVAAPSTADAVEPATTPAVPSESALVASAEKTVASTRNGLALPVGSEYAGEWVFLFALSDPVALGWQQPDSAGNVYVSATALAEGEHRLLALDVDGKVLAWAPVSVSDQDAPTPLPASPVPISSEAVSGGAFPVLALVALVSSVVVVAVAVVVVVLWRRNKAAGETVSDAD